MLGLTFTLNCSPGTARGSDTLAGLDAAMHAAGAGDRRIRVGPLAAADEGNVRCTVHFSGLGLLDGFVARLSETLRQCDVGLVDIAPAVPLERAA